jgi:hypothetical protein
VVVPREPKEMLIIVADEMRVPSQLVLAQKGVDAHMAPRPPCR